jgi:phosphoribosylformylglycinamidine cyclo-ligase
VTDPTPLTYAGAGVSLDAADAIADRLRAAVASTRTPHVMGDAGGFAGLLSASRFLDPVLVAGTDGVGSKLLYQRDLGRLRESGIDLVGMCVNDVLTSAAEPVLFLDYVAVGRLDAERVAEIVEGIAEGCRQAGCALLGGETAELPDMYGPDDLDLAGFAVGIAERRRVVGGARVEEGDVVIGLASDGVHSNGFTLVRRLLERAGVDPGDAPPGLLRPTVIYARAVKELVSFCDVRAMAHVTGGGIVGNLPRVLPARLGAELERSAWPRDEVFDWLAALGVEPDEMDRVFNMGLGYLVVVPEAESARALQACSDSGRAAYVVGRIVRGAGVRIGG